MARWASPQRQRDRHRGCRAGGRRSGEWTLTGVGFPFGVVTVFLNKTLVMVTPRCESSNATEGGQSQWQFMSYALTVTKNRYDKGWKMKEYPTRTAVLLGERGCGWALQCLWKFLELYHWKAGPGRVRIQPMARVRPSLPHHPLPPTPASVEGEIGFGRERSKASSLNFHLGKLDKEKQ